MLCADMQNLIEVGRLAVEVYRDHGTYRRPIDRRMVQDGSQFGRVHRKVLRFYIDQNRCGTHKFYRSDHCYCSMRNGHNRAARADTERSQGEDQSVGTAGKANRVRNAKPMGEVLLKSSALLRQYVSPRREHTVHSAIDAVLHGP